MQDSSTCCRIDHGSHPGASALGHWAREPACSCSLAAWVPCSGSLAAQWRSTPTRSHCSSCGSSAECRTQPRAGCQPGPAPGMASGACWSERRRRRLHKALSRGFFLFFGAHDAHKGRAIGWQNAPLLAGRAAAAAVCCCADGRRRTDAIGDSGHCAAPASEQRSVSRKEVSYRSRGRQPHPRPRSAPPSDDG